MLDARKPVPDQRMTVGAMLDIWLDDVLPGTVYGHTPDMHRRVRQAIRRCSGASYGSQP